MLWGTATAVTSAAALSYRSKVCRCCRCSFYCYYYVLPPWGESNVTTISDLAADGQSHRQALSPTIRPRLDDQTPTSSVYIYIFVGNHRRKRWMVLQHQRDHSRGGCLPNQTSGGERAAFLKKSHIRYF